MRAISVLILVALFVPSRVSGQEVTVTSLSSVEEKLAAIDAQSKRVLRSVVHQYAQVLDELDRSCKENRKQIGDFAAKGVEFLKAKKVAMSHLKFLQSMNDSTPKGPETSNMSCAEIAAHLVMTIERP